MPIRSFFDLDNIDRYIPTGEARLWCGLKKTDTKVWARYRKLLGVTAYKLTKQEAFLLWVASQVCGGKWHLTRLDIYRAAVELYRQQPEAAEWKDKQLEPELISGWDLMAKIKEETGIDRTIHTMRRWGKIPGIPWFSVKQFYTRKQVSLFVAYAKKCNRR